MWLEDRFLRLPLLMGPAPVSELLGRPTRTLFLPSACDTLPALKALVPLCSQPVTG